MIIYSKLHFFIDIFGTIPIVEQTFRELLNQESRPRAEEDANRPRTQEEDVTVRESKQSQGQPPRREQVHQQHHHHQDEGGGEQSCDISMQKRMPGSKSQASQGGTSPIKRTLNVILNKL